MSHWWRAYDEAMQDPKLLALSDRHHRAWFNLLCVASKNGGTLPNINMVAIELRVSGSRAAEYITIMVTAGLMDETEPGKFTPHNWGGRQFKNDVTDSTAAERMRNYRNRNRNADRNADRNVGVTVTVPREQNTETERIERKKDAADAASDLEVELFRRGKQVLGDNAGGLIKRLLTCKGGKINQARAAIEASADRQDPREYIGAIIRGRNDLDEVEQARLRGDRW